MRLSKALVCRLCVLLFTLPSLGQQPSACLQRTLMVGIADDHGVVPPNLTSKNFRITRRGRAVSSLRAVYSEGPRRVVVLLDISESMHGPEGKHSPQWEIARAAARSLLASLPSSSAVGLMTYADKTETRAPLSGDRRLAEEWLDSNPGHQLASLKGHSAMYDAIEAAEKQLEPTQPGDVIYIITDAGENASKIRGSKVEKSLAEAGVRLFAFLLVPSGPGTSDEIDGANELRLLAIHSGGFMQVVLANDARRGEANPVNPEQMRPLWHAFVRKGQLPVSSGMAYDASTQEQIRLHTDLLNRWISSFYFLTFQIPEGELKPIHLDVAVIDSQGHKRNNMTLAYSRTLTPCAIGTAKN